MFPRRSVLTLRDVSTCYLSVSSLISTRTILLVGISGCFRAIACVHVGASPNSLFAFSIFIFIICILFDNAIIFTKSLEFVKDFKKDKKLAFVMTMSLS